nr:MAG TPA: hypothetical protein [Caudoviricetes sp.]
MATAVCNIYLHFLSLLSTSSRDFLVPLSDYIILHVVQLVNPHFIFFRLFVNQKKQKGLSTKTV